MVARQHHYIPQFYLKGFTYNRRKPKLFCFDFKTRKAFDTPPVNIAVERDFNRVDIPGHAIDALEKGFAAEETILSAALARIIEQRSIAEPEDRSALFHLMSVLATKHPAMRENMRSFHEEISRRMLDVLVSSRDIWEHQTQKAHEAGFLKDKPVLTFDAFKEFARRGDFRIEVATEAHLAREFAMRETVYPYLASRKWILVFAPPESAGFITSDHPVSLSWSDPKMRAAVLPPGFDSEQSQVLFPISREMAMLGAFKIEEAGWEADEDLVAKINGSTMYHATRQIYASSGRFSYILKPGSKARSGVEIGNDPGFR
jgi:hypothetical protein